MSRQVVTPPGAARPFGVWSHAIEVRAARLLFVSGLTARDGEGNVVGIGDVERQTRQVLENLDRTLRAAGGALGDIASVVVYVTDIGDFDVIHAVRREFFPVDPPASTMVEVTRLVDPECRIEISAVAALP